MKILVFHVNDFQRVISAGEDFNNHGMIYSVDIS